MAFIPKTQPYGSKIREVTLGVGDQAITIGGQNTLPFYTFDAPAPHPPVIGAEVPDAEWDIPALYRDCATMVQRAKKAEALESADFLCLHFASADPAGQNRSVEDCVADAVAVAETVKKPLAVMGCQNLEKDTALFAAISAALAGKNVLFLSARSENYQAVGTSVCLENGQLICAETADDTNLAKQLNIMLRGLSVPENAMVMNIGTAAVGYGYEYVASTMDRIRLAALGDGDTDLQMPIIAPVSADTWTVKESTEEEEPAWGDREERAISMEIATAAADLTGGADGVILRHPAAMDAVKKFITALT